MLHGTGTGEQGKFQHIALQEGFKNTPDMKTAAAQRSKLRAVQPVNTARA